MSTEATDRRKHRIAGLARPAVEGMASGEALNVYERSRPTAPAKLTELGEKLLGVRPWHCDPLRR